MNTIARGTFARPVGHRSAESSPSIEDLQFALAMLLAAAGVIHLAVTPPHFREYAGFGLFFLASGLLQVGLAIWSMRRATLSGLVLAWAISVVICIIWLVSRTVGLPVGPEAGQSERVGLADLVASLYEVASAWLAIQVGRQWRTALPERVRVTGLGATFAVCLGWTTVGAIIAGH